MKISKIEGQQKRGRYNIYVNESFALGVDEDVLIKYNLKKGMEVDEEFIEEILLAEEENKALNHALKLLSYRQRSAREIYTSLQRKGYMDGQIDKVIGLCKEKGYIDDRKFAEAFARDKIKLNKFGPKRIEHELMLKGISKEIINQVVDLNRNDEYELALEIANKRLRSYRNDKRKDIYRKMSAYLQRRGFSYDIISKVVREILTAIDQEEEGE